MRKSEFIAKCLQYHRDLEAWIDELFILGATYAHIAQYVQESAQYADYATFAENVPNRVFYHWYCDNFQLSPVSAIRPAANEQAQLTAQQQIDNGQLTLF